MRTGHTGDPHDRHHQKRRARRHHPRPPRGAQDHADARAEAPMAGALRQRAAAVQPPVFGKPARLSHPGTGLWGLKPETVRRLERLGEELDGGDRKKSRKRVDQSDRPITGTRLVREWKGVEHVVTVTAQGFEWQGRPYKSLSAIARAITGTRWNGPVFFGVRRAGAAGEGARMTAAAQDPWCASSAARSTPASPPRKASIRSSTPSTPSARPARRSSQARGPRAGCSSASATTTAASPAARWSGPALQRLMADIEDGRRGSWTWWWSTRSTGSPARSPTSRSSSRCSTATASAFVSVTQSFNTTTSMGRLTLNILLSFAQFEREVTAERIRDKFAASRAKGMWMGGWAPLGYDVADRKLVVNEPEAETVRMIFRRFAEVGSATVLARELRAEGVTTKRGKAIDKKDLYKILSNRAYIGEAVHKGTSYPGEHEPRSSTARRGTASTPSCRRAHGNAPRAPAPRRRRS